LKNERVLALSYYIQQPIKIENQEGRALFCLRII